jgi:molybdopterin molybdotransferase
MTDAAHRVEHSPPLSIEAALALLLERARPLTERETVATADARNRVLAEDLSSRVDQPAWNSSAMDGYAVRTADVAPGGAELPITQRIPAGRCGGPLAPGTAARIFTGAPVPDGADTVVVQEICESDGQRVRLPGDLKPGANIRLRGEDVRAGDTVLAAGTRLAPQHLGLAASVGAEELAVLRRLRVAIFASGDELVMPGEPLNPGQIYNSNRFMYRALLDVLGCEISDLGIVEDSLGATVEALRAGAEQADLVLASGGVSVGEEDHVRPAVQRLGSLDLWRIAMRPGRPLAFGHIGDTPFIGSPGNPVSLFVTFCLFARPFILRMQGITGDLAPIRLRARADFDLAKPVSRREYLRARLTQTAQGDATVEVFPSRSSAALTSLAWADGLVEVAKGQTVAVGDPVLFIPFSELIP